MATVAGTRTIPFAWYSDPAVLRLERERIFRRSWQYAGRAGQAAEPGSFFTCDLGGVPVVVVRDGDELRAFLNVCRHRGSLVCEGEGKRATLQCPYHAWTYALDGSLRAAPRADQEAGFDRDGLGLLPVAVDTWGPFVFVNPDAEAGPLAETLGELPQLVAAAGLDVDALVFLKRSHGTYEANWKVCTENFLECYHCQVAHPGFSDLVDVSPEAYRLERHETFASHHVRTRDGQGGGQFHMIWPSTKINIFPGAPNVSIGPLTPTGVGRTDGFLDYFFLADADPTEMAELIELDDEVGAEDRVLVESVQRGLRARAFEHGRLMLPSEELIADFQRWVAAGLA
jgi:phenylpropionate dioxygenase-like ring-hydroxylating dioxygenase large terminal subunit